MAFESQSADKAKEIHVKFLLPFSLNLPNGVYGITNKKFCCTVNIRKKLVKDNASGMRGGMHIADDRFGLTNNTKVLVRFVLKQEHLVSEISQQQLKQFSLDSINSILDQCRLNTDEYYNHDLVSKDVSGTEYKFLKIDGNEALGTTILIRGGGTMSLSTSGSSVKDESLKLIQENLKTAKPFSFIVELIKNAIDYFRFENFRITVIEIETAIEIMLSNIIVKFLTDLQQTDSAQVESILSSARISNCTIEDFPRASPRIVRPILRRATFDTITNSTELCEWEKKCQKLRHRIVHGGYLPTESEASEAVEISLKFFKVLQQYHPELNSEIIEFEFPPQKSGEFLMFEQNTVLFQLGDFEDISQIDYELIQKKKLESKEKIKANKISDALDCYDEILKLDPLNVDILNDKANLFFNDVKIPEASQCYEKMIEIDPSEVLGFMGWVTAKLNKMIFAED